MSGCCDKMSVTVFEMENSEGLPMFQVRHERRRGLADMRAQNKGKNKGADGFELVNGRMDILFLLKLVSVIKTIVKTTGKRVLFRITASRRRIFTAVIKVVIKSSKTAIALLPLGV